jgi:putative transposase
MCEAHICENLDLKKYYNIIDTSNNKKRVNRAREKIYNKIQDMHWKSANFLVDNYDIIGIGNCSTSSIIQNDLPKITKRNMSAQSNFLFKQRLYSKCEEHNKSLLEIDERYTSKTCSSCGEYNDVGRSKEYNCGKCELRIDRDLNASKNIFTRLNALRI